MIKSFQSKNLATQLLAALDNFCKWWKIMKNSGVKNANFPTRFSIIFHIFQHEHLPLQVLGKRIEGQDPQQGG